MHLHECLKIYWPNRLSLDRYVFPTFNIMCSIANHAMYMSRDMTKPTKWVCAQRRLRSAWASAQSDQSSLSAEWVAKDPSFLHADSEDSDQTDLSRRWAHTHFVGFVIFRLIWIQQGPKFVCKLAQSNQFNFQFVDIWFPHLQLCIFYCFLLLSKIVLRGEW